MSHKIETQGHQPSLPELKHPSYPLYDRDDAETKLKLSKSTEAFNPSLSPSDRPTSRHYFLAQQCLTEAQNIIGPHRNQLLADAEHNLKIADQAEGDSLRSEPIKFALQYERARLAYLRGEYEEARKSFEILHEFFVSVQDETMIKRVKEFRLCIEACSACIADGPTNVSEASLARCLLDILEKNAYQSDSPLSSLLLHLLRRISQTSKDEIYAAAFQLVEDQFDQHQSEMEELKDELKEDTRKFKLDAVSFLVQLAAAQNSRYK